MTAPVLVTGAGGCIGAWVIRRLCDSQTPVVAFDLSSERRRLSLLFSDAAAADAVVWETGDIADSARVHEVFLRHRPAVVIHLAALQVPFCIADPVLGAQVNVVGCVNVFEAAVRCSVKKVVYASSVAATAMGAESPWKQTLYGAYKRCNEDIARVYWHDHGVPSIGIRPSVVYGPARDQGMSAAPTKAMLAAVLGKPYTIPFTGSVGFVYAGEAAAAFIAAAAAENGGAKIFPLSGTQNEVQEVVDMIIARRSLAEISCTGKPLPFPADDSDEPLRDCIGNYWQPSFDDGLDETLALFEQRVQEGRIDSQDLEEQ